MTKLFTSTLLTVAAVPFLMAAPAAAKKVQNQAPQSTTTAPAKAKKVKKTKKTTTATAATATTPSQK